MQRILGLGSCGALHVESLIIRFLFSNAYISLSLSPSGSIPIISKVFSGKYNEHYLVDHLFLVKFSVSTNHKYVFL
jgi:hypothetical protein